MIVEERKKREQNKLKQTKNVESNSKDIEQFCLVPANSKLKKHLCYGYDDCIFVVDMDIVCSYFSICKSMLQ